MLVVDVTMEDGNQVIGAVIFKVNEQGAKSLQDYNEIKDLFRNKFKEAAMIHYNTKYMSGNIIAKSVVTFEVRELETTF